MSRKREKKRESITIKTIDEANYFNNIQLYIY